MASRLFETAFVAFAVGVTGETVRLKYQSDGDSPHYCLAVKAPFNSPSTRSDGSRVEIRNCSHQQSNNGPSDLELADLWRIDPDGLAISHISGLCLTHATGGLTQTTCTRNSSKWQLDETEKAFKSSTTGECVGIGEGNMIQMQACNTTTAGGWVVERSTLVAYPVHELKYLSSASPHYRVALTQGDNVYYPFVNLMSTTDRDPDERRGLTNSFLTFSFEGEVKVTVTSLAEEKIQVAVVRPLSSGINPVVIDDHTIEFTVSEANSKLSVEFDDKWQKNSLLLFADPLEKDVPAMFGNGVRYVNVGEHTLNHADLQSNEVVYVAGGAWVVAESESLALLGTSTSSSFENIKIMGRGVLSGTATTESLGDSSSALISLCGNNIEIEGITVCEPPAVQVFQVNAPWYCEDGWQGSVRGAHVHNVKLMGWNFADGIIAGSGSHVHNVFTRLNDDNVKPMMGDSVFENNVHWQGGNGWAIMLGWCGYEKQSNITVRRSTVIHDDHSYDYAVDGCDPCTESQASIGAVQGGSGTLEDVLIEDIVLESQVMRPFFFGIQKNFWASEGTGIFNNWTIKNLQVLQGSWEHSVVWGADDETQVQSLRFKDMTLYGEPVSTFQDANIDLHGHMQAVGFGENDGHLLETHI